MEPDRKLERVKIVISFGKKASRKFSIKPPGGLIFFQALLRGGGGGLKERGELI